MPHINSTIRTAPKAATTTPKPTVKTNTAATGQTTSAGWGAKPTAALKMTSAGFVNPLNKSTFPVGKGFSVSSAPEQKVHT